MERTKSLIGKIIDWTFSVAIYAVLIFVIFTVATKAVSFYEVGYDLFFQEAKDAPGTGMQTTITITENMSVRDVGKLLKSEGIIENEWLFWLQEKVSDYSGMIRPGTYEVSSEMTAEEILNIITLEGQEPEVTEEVPVESGEGTGDKSGETGNDG